MIGGPVLPKPRRTSSASGKTGDESRGAAAPHEDEGVRYTHGPRQPATAHEQPETETTPPVTLAGSEAYLYITNGKLGKAGLEATEKGAAQLYPVMLSLANVKAVGEQAVKDYEDAKRGHEKALAKSTIEKLIGAIGVIAEISTGVGGILALAQTIGSSAKGLQDAYSMYKATHGAFGEGVAKEIGRDAIKESGHAIHEGAKGAKAAYEGRELLGAPTVDPET
ncbi:MAG TPA: hypothetical protein VMM27_02275, partial [Casimicrobiaceae bacterium]|nr:hypothetical protein [Casimicrobiaceae bacterium]